MESLILKSIRHHAAERPDAIALQGVRETVTFGQLPALIEDFARSLRERGAMVLATLTDNHPAGALMALATQQADVCLLGLPPFLSDAQIWHALRDSGANGLFTDQPQRLEAIYRAQGVDAPSMRPETVCGTTLFFCEPPPGIRDPRALLGMAQVTYTSGSTGKPKGVMLRQSAIDKVVEGLLEPMAPKPGEKQLSVLPLVQLLEIVAGTYLSLVGGRTSVLWPFASMGLTGSRGLDLQKFAAAIRESETASLFTSPVALNLLTQAREAGTIPEMPHLRFFGVGGAAVSKGLIERAWKVGLPVYQGYGLTETASVVTLNRPGANRLESVGQALSHVQLKVSSEGELLVGGSLFDGYVGGEDADLPKDGFLATGDLARVDEEGYVHITGRKKNIFITSFGRNVSPEWVETEVAHHRAIGQVAVFGEGRPFNVAVIFPADGARDEEVDEAIAKANATLPDYAQISRWVRATEAFTAANGLLTATGKLLRERIHAAYAASIEALYTEDAAKDAGHT